MPSADSCALIRAPCGSPSSSIGTGRRPPQVSSIAFAAHLRDLQLWPLMDLDFAIRCPLVRPRDASYPVSVRQVAALLHTAFRRHLAMTPLCFANPSPPSGWAGDFHPQAIKHAGHTTKPLRSKERSNPIFSIDLRTSSTHTGVTIAVAWFIADVWMDQPAL